MSSQASQESVLKAFEAGAKDYLIKPVRRNELATLWQHVWRVNRDLMPQNGAPVKFLSARTKPHSTSEQSTADTQQYNRDAISSLQLLCEVASNEQASANQAHPYRDSSSFDRSHQYIAQQASAELQMSGHTVLDPVELHIRPLDVAPAHPAAQRAVSGPLPAQFGPSNATMYNMPAALRELAALGNRLEQERTSSAAVMKRSRQMDQTLPMHFVTVKALLHSRASLPLSHGLAVVVTLKHSQRHLQLHAFSSCH